MPHNLQLSVCVFCGSKTGTNPAFVGAAVDLGTRIAKSGMRLVYGAGDIGLMGSVANAAQIAGGDVFGVIPEHLLQWEVGKRDLTQFIVTETMHERKKVMAMNSNAFVLLPGGLGSLDEFFEIITWRQLKLHDKPTYVLNVDGYWDGLKTLIDSQIDAGFVGEFNREFFTFFDDVDALMTALDQLA